MWKIILPLSLGFNLGLWANASLDLAAQKQCSVSGIEGSISNSGDKSTGSSNVENTCAIEASSTNKLKKKTLPKVAQSSKHSKKNLNLKAQDKKRTNRKSQMSY